MAAVTSPLRACRGILKEIRLMKGSGYRHTLVYNYVLDQFRRNQREVNTRTPEQGAAPGEQGAAPGEQGAAPGEQVTGAQYCRERMDALHTACTYQCLLTSTRMHLQLHEVYHARGERDTAQVAGLVGLRLPTQPGGKGWET